MPEPVDFRVLGPLEVSIGDVPGPQPSPLRRRLLAALLARAGRQLTVDQLIEVAWAGSPPPSAAASIQVHLHRLRRNIGDAGHIVRGAAGYQITVTPDEFDAMRFTELTARARRERESGHAETALGTVRRALSLWRGEPYDGIARSSLIAAAADRLAARRFSALREMHELSLDLGRHAEVLSSLSELAGEHPYDEHLGALLMLALYRAGRQTDALAVFRGTRAQMVDQLGVEPGATLRRMHEAVLRSDERLADVATGSLGATWVSVGPIAAESGERPSEVPRELPRPPYPFTGRDAELRALDRLADGSGPAPLAVITGMGGIGKTALAVHWAHRAADRFPDGQLYIDLRGHGDAPPLRPIEALGTMLSSLGVPPAHIPLDADQAAARLRTRTGGRRMLIVLDNAADADQVRPLLPGGAGSMVVVTSRRRIGGLIAWHGGTSLTLGPLADLDARDLVARLVAVPAAAAEELADLCGRLPLALRIAAANLSEGPRPDVASYIARLAGDDRLGSLQIVGSADDAAVRAVFESSYRAMPHDARRLFRLLGTIPGPDITAEAAASLAGTGADAAERALDRLVGAHLVERHRPGRYRLHDLLGLYAAERAETEDSRADIDTAVERLLKWYLHRADACRGRLYPSFFHLPLPERRETPIEMDAATAGAWLKAEHKNLLAVVLHAADHGPRRISWLLNDVLRGYMWLGVHGADGLRAGRAALAAARAEGDLAGQTVAELSLVTALLRSNRPQDAIDHGLRAVELASEADLLPCRAAAQQNIAHACASLGRLREAIAHAEAAELAYRELGKAEGRCAALTMLAVAHNHLGEVDTAIGHLEEALELAVEHGKFTFEASLRANLALAHLLRGDLDEARSYIDEVLAARSDGGGIGHNSAHLTLAARIHLASGRDGEALKFATRAVESHGAFSDHRVESNALSALAAVRDALGEHREAVGHYDRALELIGDDGAYYRVEATCGRAAALLKLGETERARRDATAALETAEACEYRLLQDRARGLLAAIDAAEHLRPGRGSVTRASPTS
ncbi:AfsR/SARP family transcriptional regulator [Glycomyces tarimensis]